MAATKMPSWLPSFPYPAPKVGYWLPVTSTLNWCEEDYYATEYSAEIVNTVTNALFIILAIRGALNCIREGHDKIFLITFLGYLCVGSGSLAFHATLKYPMQLVDELSMIYTTCLMCWASFSHSRSPSTQFLLALLFSSIALFITLYYHFLQDPSFHQNAYAALTIMVLFRSMYIKEKSLRPSRGKRERALKQAKEKGHAVTTAELDRRDARDTAILKTMWIMVAYGIGTFLLGFTIWNLDNNYCSTLRKWRHSIGLPWGLFLEGHGWWHIFTGIGSYFWITWAIYLRHCLNGRQDEFELDWPRLTTSLPVVRRKGGEGNGVVKKNI